MGTWDIARYPVSCATQGCGTTIGAGEQVRRVGVSDYCVPCAKRRFDLEPPPQMPEAFGEAMRRMGERAGFVPVRDFKIAQYEREPGEEG